MSAGYRPKGRGGPGQPPHGGSAGTRESEVSLRAKVRGEALEEAARWHDAEREKLLPVAGTLKAISPETDCSDIKAKQDLAFFHEWSATCLRALSRSAAAPGEEVQD